MKFTKLRRKRKAPENLFVNYCDNCQRAGQKNEMIFTTAHTSCQTTKTLILHSPKGNAGNNKRTHLFCPICNNLLYFAT